LQEGVRVEPIHNQIIPKVLDKDRSVVRYLHVLEIPDQYSIGIFVFPPHAKIPLHDHPDMCVISRLLYGSLTLKSFDIVQDMAPSIEFDEDLVHEAGEMNFDPRDSLSTIDMTDMDQQQLRSSQRMSVSSTYSWGSIASSAMDLESRARSSWFSTRTPSLLRPLRESSRISTNLLPPGAKRVTHSKLLDGEARNKNELVLHAPEVTMLFPQLGNLHEFIAGPEGAAVLDVLVPPYHDDDERDCTFYRVANEIPAKMVVDADCRDVQPVFVVLPIDQPSDYHCTPGRYAEYGKYDEEL